MKKKPQSSTKLGRGLSDLLPSANQSAFFNALDNTKPKEERMALTPLEVSQVDLAFPADVIGKYLPKWEEIPDEFKKFSGKWQEVADRIFFNGGKGIELEPKEGIDSKLAFKHVSTCLRSFQPSHEHKISGVAYLLSEFFTDAKLPTD